jgi:transposase
VTRRGQFRLSLETGEEVVPVSELRAAHLHIRELQRLLGKKTHENELLREAVERVAAPKKLPLRVSSWPGDGR